MNFVVYPGFSIDMDQTGFCCVGQTLYRVHRSVCDDTYELYRLPWPKGSFDVTDSTDFPEPEEGEGCEDELTGEIQPPVEDEDHAWEQVDEYEAEELMADATIEENGEIFHFSDCCCDDGDDAWGDDD